MGTETLHRKNRYLNSFQILVKLNNPLMGTETCYTQLVLLKSKP